MHPRVSLCLPVFGSERFLRFCLESIARQDFKEYEIVVVNDFSSGTDEQGNSCKQIIKSFHKAHRKISINYIEHTRNKGLFETRRTAVFAARGEYIFNVDSDDFISETAISSLYKEAVAQNADIIQGQSCAGSFADDKVCGEYSDFIPANENRYGNIYLGTLENHDIFSACYTDNSFSGMMWGRLIRRELYLEALDKIPPAFCNLGEEYLQFFFIAYMAKKYVGVDNLVYYYRQNSGMTAAKLITSIKDWEMACSISTAYSIVYSWIEEEKEKTGNYPLSEQEIECIRVRIRVFVYNNLMALEHNVVPELKEEAHAILCEYWGESFVKRVEEVIKKEEKIDKSKLD